MFRTHSCLNVYSMCESSCVLLEPHAAGTRGLDNNRCHCWPLAALAANPTPYSSCPGIDIDWLVAPPDTVKAERGFNVRDTYHLEISSSFYYSWAAIAGIFDNAGTTGGFNNDQPYTLLLLSRGRH